MKQTNIYKMYLKTGALLYIGLQIILMVLLRHKFLMTVYQTVTVYAAVCIVGIVISYCVERVHKHRRIWDDIKDTYMIVWSAFHGVIVLGFLSCGTYYLTITQITIVQIVNIFLGFVIYWTAYILTRKCHIAIGIGNLFILILGIANHYLVRFRGTPFQVADIFSVQTAISVAGGYDFTPDAMLVVSIADLLIWWLFVYLLYHSSKRTKYNLWNVAISFVVLLGCFLLPVTNYDRTAILHTTFAKDNVLSDLVIELIGNANVLPEDYHIEDVTDIIRANRVNLTEENNKKQKPNLIVIMNEAFSDLRVLGEIPTDENVMPIWDAIKQQSHYGWANVSVLGGNTANSEYEFLTSDSMGAYNGIIPYNAYFNERETYPGLVENLNRQGYETTVFHPYYSSGWNRLQVYHAMNFQHIFFLDTIELEQTELIRNYISDSSDYHYVMDWFDKKEPGVPQFYFNITMQNHGGYTYDNEEYPPAVQLSGELHGKFPQAEQFLSLVHTSDQALEALFSYFSDYPEPVIIMIFGDHQPLLEDGFYTTVTGTARSEWDLSQIRNIYKTPFVLWSNESSKSEDLGEVSLNYMSSILLEYAGLQESPYQRYVSVLREKLPVISSIAIENQNGQIYQNGTEEYRNLIQDYRVLVYNHTADSDGRIREFYSLENSQ
jgi:phosphoglycerol transferase MdoB-like AlkP superfamily enzyme